jgi:integrase
MNQRRSTRAAHSMKQATPVSYDVKMWKIRVNEGTRGKTYTVRWVLDGQEWRDTFKTRALAESFRSDLISATRRGEAFDVATGRPLSLLPDDEPGQSWYSHACAFVDIKWPAMAGKSRTSLADALASVTMALLPKRRDRPSDAALRSALYGWAFNSKARKDAAHPKQSDAAEWVREHTPLLRDLDEPAVLRKTLDTMSLRMDGKPAAATTVARRRTALHGALEYAVELGHLESNPMTKVRWTAPKVAEAIDRSVVVNPSQARALLEAVGTDGGPSGPHLKAFFGCLYYAALRPEEAVELQRWECTLPEEGWGELVLSTSAPWAGKAWTDDGSTRDRRQLKHRARRETRPVPAPPELVALLRNHLDQFGTTDDGRLFRGAWGRPLNESSYGRVWKAARREALTPEQEASPLAGRPYDLRHAAVSFWLNAGVPPQRVAAWAGHSVHVLLKVYAKCVDGEEEVARQRVEAALKVGRDAEKS